MARYGERYSTPAYREVDSFPKKGRPLPLDVSHNGGDDMVLCNSDEDDSTSRKGRAMETKERSGRSSRNERVREQPLRVVPLKISSDAIRDGIVYIEECYYDFLMRFIEHINSTGKKGQQQLKLIETVSEATYAERSRICLPAKLEPFRERLLHCDVCVEGLPASVFFGSGFGSRNFEARASASKDLVDKCLRLGIVSQNMHAVIGEKSDLNRRTRLPHFNNAAKAINFIIEFMSRETWPSDVMTAREIEPRVIDKLKKLLDKAVKRSYSEDVKLKEDQNSRPNVSKSAREESLPVYCSQCQQYGHAVHDCPKIKQRPVVTQADIEAKIQKQREELMRREQIRTTDIPPIIAPGASHASYVHNGPVRFPTEDSHTYNPSSDYPHPSYAAHDSYSPVYRKTTEEILREKEEEIRRKVELEMEARRLKIEAEVRERIRREEREKIEMEMRMKYDNRPPYNGPAIPEPSRPSINSDAEPAYRAITGYGLGTSFGLHGDRDGNFYFTPREYAANPSRRHELDDISRNITDIERMLGQLERGGESVMDEDIQKEMMRAVHEMGNQARGLDRGQQLLMLSQLKALLQQALDERAERKNAKNRRERANSSSRVRSRSRSPAITYVTMGNMHLRSLDRREMRLFERGEIKGCAVWAQDMKTGRFQEGMITKVSNRGRVIMQVGGAEWRKELNEIFIPRDMVFHSR